MAKDTTSTDYIGRMDNANARRLRRLRQRTGRSIAIIADQLGISAGNASNLLRGLTRPSPRIRRTIADVAPTTIGINLPSVDWDRR